ncbi:MAG: hypothetical protein NWQ09_11495, partial [Nonlabens sp.]|nr:hypothetical protein [Nonlabens sp.]
IFLQIKAKYNDIVGLKLQISIPKFQIPYSAFPDGNTLLPIAYSLFPISNGLLPILCCAVLCSKYQNRQLAIGNWQSTIGNR